MLCSFWGYLDGIIRAKAVCPRSKECLVSKETLSEVRFGRSTQVSQKGSSLERVILSLCISAESLSVVAFLRQRITL
jgi:hypothetical protein